MKSSDFVDVFEHCVFDRDFDGGLVWVPLYSVCLERGQWADRHPYELQYYGKMAGPMEDCRKMGTRPRRRRKPGSGFPCVGCDLVFRTQAEFDGHVKWRFGGEVKPIAFGSLLEKFLKRGIGTDEAYRVAGMVDASLSEDAFKNVTQMFRLDLGIVDASWLENAEKCQELFRRYRSDWFRAFVLRVRLQQFPDAQVGLSDSECIESLLNSFLNSGDVHRQKIIKRLFDGENVRLQDCISLGKTVSEQTRKAVGKIIRLELRGLKAAEAFDRQGGDHFLPKTAVQRYKEKSWTGDLDSLKQQVSRDARRKYKTPR